MSNFRTTIGIASICGGSLEEMARVQAAAANRDYTTANRPRFLSEKNIPTDLQKYL